jgi:hypothetical protein
LRRCLYCAERIRFWTKLCSDCKKLLAKVGELRVGSGYGQFLAGLEETGVAKEKIAAFLQADPDGKGSVQDQITAEMASELMVVMGLKGKQTAEDVKKIRDSIERESR